MSSAVFDAPICTTQNCRNTKNEECVRKKCLSKVQGLFNYLNKTIARNIEVHEAILSSTNSKLSSAISKEERKVLREVVKATRKYLLMYRQYQTATSEKEKLQWYIKYYME